MLAGTVPIDQAVADVCTRFERDTTIEVSNHARALATLVLRAISEDRHPNWQVDDSKLDLLTQTYLSALPMMLYQIVSSERVEKRITSFDFLHWLSKYFETMMCIIPK